MPRKVLTSSQTTDNANGLDCVTICLDEDESGNYLLEINTLVETDRCGQMKFSTALSSKMIKEMAARMLSAVFQKEEENETQNNA